MSAEISEISKAYNQHIANLDEARSVFEEEIKGLNEVIVRHLNDVYATQENTYGQAGARWQKPKPSYPAQAISWLNYRAQTGIMLDMRAPEATNYKRDAAEVYFVFRFDDRKRRFVFRARFENRNRVNDLIDEKIFEHTKLDSARYPNSQTIKSNTVIIFEREIDDDLAVNLQKYIEDAMMAIDSGLRLLYPHQSDESGNLVSDSDNA